MQLISLDDVATRMGSRVSPGSCRARKWPLLTATPSARGDQADGPAGFPQRSRLRRVPHDTGSPARLVARRLDLLR